MVKTRLIFTLYTIYGILFKGESCAYVRARGVCVHRDRVMWQNARFHTCRGPAWGRETPLTLPRSLVLSVHACTCTEYVHTWELRKRKRGKRAGGLCARARVYLSRVLIFRNEGNPICSTVGSSGTRPLPPNTVARLFCCTTSCSVRKW